MGFFSSEAGGGETRGIWPEILRWMDPRDVCNIESNFKFSLEVVWGKLSGHCISSPLPGRVQ